MFVLIGLQVFPGRLYTSIDFYLFNFHLQLNYYTNKWIEILKCKK